MMAGRSSGASRPGIWRLIGMLACAGFLLSGGGLSPAVAAEKSGVDAVLVIDSSGSMKWTDPRRLRVPAAKLFLSLLGEQDRVGIISFSDNGYPVLGLTKAGMANQPRLFAAVEKVSEKGAYTNLHAALAKGLEVLAREGDPQRRRMLVLMTDGKMDTGDWDQDRNLIDTIRTGLVEQARQAGIEVYTIAFTEASDMALMQEIAERTAALSRLASNDRELHEVFSQIFESAKQPDMLPIEGGRFMVDAAVEEMTIVASKAAAAVVVSLEAPDGSRIDAANAGRGVRWFKSEQFDMITVEKPTAGGWRLVSSDNRGDRAYVVTNLGLDARVGEKPIYIDTPQTSEAWLHENAEVIVKPELLAQTRFTATITAPDGASSESTLADAGADGDRAAGDGVFSNVLAFAQPGQHKIRVLAQNPNFQREKTLILDVVAPEVDTSQPPLAAEPEAAAPAQESAEPETEVPVADEPAPEAAPASGETAADAEPTDKGLNIGLLVSLFVLVNVLIAAGVGGFIFWRKRKAAKAAAAAASAEDEEA
jgi:Mg-chelatase subunit ChlD